MDKKSYKPFFVLATLLLMGINAHGSNSDIQVLSSTESDFHFISSQSNTLSGLDQLKGEDSTITLYKSVLVGLPVGADVSLRFVKPGTLVSVTDDKRLFLSHNQQSPKSLVTLSAPMIIRGRRVVAVRIFPVSGSGVYSEVEVQLDFSLRRSTKQIETVEAKSDPGFDRIFLASVVNYDQFITWPVRPVRPARLVRPAPSISSSQSVNVAPHPFTISSVWYKLTVDQNGMYQLSGADLEKAGLSLTGLISSEIRLFYSGGKPLEVENSKPRAELRELPLIMVDGGDGTFGRGDRIYFYGEGMNRWNYIPGQSPRFISNHYTTENVYWLTTSPVFSGQGLRMAEVSADPNLSFADTIINSFTRRVRVEQNNILSVEPTGNDQEYFEWYWTDASGLTFFVNTPGAMNGETADIFLNGRTSGNSGTQSGFMDLRVNSQAGLNKSCNRLTCRYQTTSLIDGGNRFDLTLVPSNPTIGVAPYFNFAEVTYRSSLRPGSDKIDITLDNMSGTGRIQIEDNFSASPALLDLSDPRLPVRLINYGQSNGLIEFNSPLSATGPNRFYAQTLTSSLTPRSITRVIVNNMRADLSQADMIIVTSAELVPALSEYISYREGQGHSIKTVIVDDIMQNFGNGLFDPTAIRDYLKFAYENFATPAPSKVLFVGDGNYDMLNHTGTGSTNIVPPYIHGLRQIYNDDSYVYFGAYGLLDSDTSFVGGGRGFDMLTSRWPVRSSEEISTITQKTKSYESSTNFGSWRTTVALVSDDEFAATRINEIFHTIQTEELEKSHLPRYFTRDKIYLWDYPFVNRFKPGVNDAIVNSFNRGALVVNYVGHGNPDLWAHEHVFTRSDDLPRLNNASRLPLVFAASCQINFFDDPQTPGMGEGLLSMPNGGAIGVIAATRLVYSGPNADLNRAGYDMLMFNDSLTIAEALFTAKLKRQFRNPGFPVEQQNDAAYMYFGDPYVKLGLPNYRIEFSQAPDTLVALGKSRVAGRIVDGNGLTISADGILNIEVFDSERSRTHRVLDGRGNLFGSLTYDVTGPTISRGSATVSGGQFSFEFVTPLDVSFGDNGARVSLYAVLGDVDAVGLIDSLPVSNQIAVSTDSVGPAISFSVAGKSSFASGDNVRGSDILTIVISDPSGINIAGGIGHGITLEVDGDAQSVSNLGKDFVYNQDDFSTGSATFLLDKLSPGERTLKIKAWDNANNSSTTSLSVDVSSASGLAINDLLNYPNPMSDRTTFYFELTEPASRFSLEIFTLAGRKIRTFNQTGLPADLYPNGNFSLVWDGRDATGDRIATGVYIYKATAQSQAGSGAAESFGKIVVVNQ